MTPFEISLHSLDKAKAVFKGNVIGTSTKEVGFPKKEVTTDVIDVQVTVAKEVWEAHGKPNLIRVYLD